MFKLFNRSALAGYLGFCVAVSPGISPTTALAGHSKQMICVGAGNYSGRRLGSEQGDNLCQAYEGKVLLLVNTTGSCSFTGHYHDLEQLYEKYRDRRFVLMVFPSNEFANREPGAEKSTRKFRRLTYNFHFPMYVEPKIKGDKADPFYKALAETAVKAPNWDFHKDLIDRREMFTGSFGSRINPQGTGMTQEIERWF